MERYWSIISVALSLFVFAEVNACKRKDIPLGKDAEVICNLHPSCTAGFWKTTSSLKSEETRYFTSKNCSGCNGKFMVTDRKDPKTMQYESGLKFINASWDMNGHYNCSCFNSSDNIKKRCFSISIYMDCFIGIGLDNVTIDFQGNTNSLPETTEHTLDVKAGAKVHFRCHNGKRIKVAGENCSHFENGKDVTVDESHDKCKVACVRKERNRKTCRVRVLLNVNASESKDNTTLTDELGNCTNKVAFHWCLLALNGVLLTLFCGILMYSLHSFRQKFYCQRRINMRKPKDNDNGESYYAIGTRSHSEYARHEGTFFSNNNIAVFIRDDIEEETPAGINPYLVSEPDIIFGSVRPRGGSDIGQSVDNPTDGCQKETPAGYTYMASPTATLQRPEPNEIDLYSFEEKYNAIPDI